MLGGARPSPPTGAAVDEFDQLDASHADRAAAFDRVVALFDEFIPDDDCGQDVARRITECVEQGRPASFIRLSDGEGAVLALRLGDFPALTEYAARQASLHHLGDADLFVRGAPELQGHFATAIRNADLIGIPARRQLHLLLDVPRERVQVRGTLGVAMVYAYLERYADELDLARKVATSDRFNRAMLPLYRTLIEDREIGLVSAYPELRDALCQRMGARSVRFHPVPMSANLAPGKSTDTGHFPVRYRELQDELSNVPEGMLYLVAAGMLGRVNCEWIRAAGGIAIDVGSAVDIWAGRQSRPGITQDLVDDWRLL